MSYPQCIQSKSGVLRVFLCLLMTVPTPGLSAQKKAKNPNTLTECLAFTYRTNPVLQGKRVRLQKAVSAYNISKVGWMPSVDLSLSRGMAWDKKNTQWSPPSYTSDIHVSLFEGGKSVPELKKNYYTLQRQIQELALEEQRVFLQGIQAYIAVWGQKKILQHLQESLPAARHVLEEVNTKYRVGSCTKAEMVSAASQYTGLQAKKEVALFQLEKACREFKKIMGCHPPSFTKELSEKDFSLPHSLSQAIRIALNTSPALQSCLFREQEASYDLIAKKTAMLPKVGLNVRHNLSQKETQGPTVLFSASIPIFKNGQIYTPIYQSSKDKLAASFETQDVRESVITNTTNAWYQYQSTRKNMLQCELEINAKTLYLGREHEEYKLGKKSSLDVLKAQDEKRKALIKLIQNRQNIFVHACDMLKEMGLLRAKNLPFFSLKFKQGSGT